MADINIDASIPLGGKQTDSMSSLGNMLNIARNAQAYQQSQQINPLELEAKQLELQKAQATLQPSIRQAEAEASKSELGLNEKQLSVAGGLLTGVKALESYQNNDPKALKKDLSIIEGIAKASGIPTEQTFSHINKLLEKGDMKGVNSAIDALQTGLTTHETQLNASMPQIGTNAAGQTTMTNKRSGQQVVAGQPNAPAPNPMNVNVTNFGDYQKDVTARASASNQFKVRADELKNLLTEFKPGAGSTTYQSIAEKLQTVGAPQDLVDKVAGGDLSASQSFNKFLAQSVISGIRQSAGNDPARVAEIENYIKNNPTINTDPRALERFINFTEKQADRDLVEQAYLNAKLKSGTLNPETHIGEFQSFAREQGYLPPIRNPEATKPPESKKDHGEIVKIGKYNGHTVVQYADGTVGYK